MKSMSLALSYQAMTCAHRERALDVGPIRATKETQKKVSLPPSSEDWCWWEGLLCLGWREAKGIAEVLDLGTESDKATMVDPSTIDDVVGSARTLRTVKLSEYISDRGGER